MSLILDALRKAEAERTRGQVPRLDAQTPLSAGMRRPQRNGSLPGLTTAASGLLGVLLVAVLVVGAWTLGRHANTRGQNAQPAQTATTAPLVSTEPDGQTFRGSPQTDTTSPPQIEKSAPEPVAIETLPPVVRAQLPPLKLNGRIYSSRAAERSVIVDGLVLREQDAISQDLTLERVETNAVVFRWRDILLRVQD